MCIQRRLHQELHDLFLNEEVQILAQISRVSNRYIRSPWIIGRYCGATKTTKAVSVTANCSLVSVHKIPETACPTSSFECNEMTVQACLKSMNDWTIICIIRQSLPLRSKQSSCSTLVSQAFTHPCANRWQVAVAAHSFSKAEIDEMTDPTNALYDQTW